MTGSKNGTHRDFLLMLSFCHGAKHQLKRATILFCRQPLIGLHVRAVSTGEQMVLRFILVPGTGAEAKKVSKHRATMILKAIEICFPRAARQRSQRGGARVDARLSSQYWPHRRCPERASTLVHVARLRKLGGNCPQRTLMPFRRVAALGLLLSLRSFSVSR